MSKMKKRVKVHGFLMFVAAALIALFPRGFLRLGKSNYDLIFFLIGLLLLSLGFYLRIWARGFKSEHSDNSKKLVIGGPYNLTRNPMYLGICLIAVALGFLGFRLWVLLVFSLFFAVCYLRLMYQEEKTLTEVFGESYLEYKNRTPLFIPRLSALFKKDTENSLKIKTAWIKKEASALLPIFLLALGFNLWKLLK